MVAGGSGGGDVGGAVGRDGEGPGQVAARAVWGWGGGDVVQARGELLGDHCVGDCVVGGVVDHDRVGDVLGTGGLDRY